MAKYIIIRENAVSRFLFSDTRSAILWFVIRLYVGYEWLDAGIGKVTSADWTGATSGAALSGFIKGALSKTGGAHPDVQGWYAYFLEHYVLTHPVAWAHAVAWGEVLVGAGLILGLFTGIAAFFGLFMNLNYLLSGTVSSNPILFVLSIGLVLAWKVAGYLGFDKYVLPFLGTPWVLGDAFKRAEPPNPDSPSS